MDLNAKRTLGNCAFDEEDDMKYLINDVAWIESKSEALAEDEVQYLFKLVQRLQRMEIDLISIRFAKRILNDYFSDEYLETLTSERKSSLRSIFLAAAVRELIIRNETKPKMDDARRNFIARYPFLLNQDGSDTELTWLNRFERAMRYLRLVLPAKGNKKNYLEIAAHLQGSPVFIHYVPGGANPPTTQRRVDLFVKLTGIEIVKRSPKDGDSPKLLEKLVVKRGRGRPRKNPLATPTPVAASTYSKTNSRVTAKKPTCFSYADFGAEDDSEDDEEEMNTFIEMDHKTVEYSHNTDEMDMCKEEEQAKQADEINDDELVSFLTAHFDDPMDFLQITPSSDASSYSSGYAHLTPEESDEDTLIASLFA